MNPKNLTACLIWYDDPDTREVTEILRDQYHVDLQLKTEPSFEAYLVTGYGADDADAVLAERLAQGWPDRPVIWFDGCGALWLHSSVSGFAAQVTKTFAEVFPQAVTVVTRGELIAILREANRELANLSPAYDRNAAGGNEPRPLRDLIGRLEHGAPISEEA